MKNRYSQLPFALFLLLACTAASALYGQDDKKQLTNLPTIYVDTYDKAGVHSKEIYTYSTLTYLEEDSVAVYDSVRIRGRGNSTWGLAKKPYRIKFNEKQKFLGKGYSKAKDWTLLANMTDKTLLRNAVTAEMGEFMGIDFNPAAKFVDFYLDGSYRGNYQVSDQVEVKAHRVEVEEQDYPLQDTSDITGGYLLEVDGFATSEPVYFRTNKNLLVTIKYPKDDEIVLDQIVYIREHVKKFETVLFSDDFKDPVKGYKAYVDTTSLIKWYVALEFSGNTDGFWSTYIYKKQKDDRLYFGPLWDNDIAYNNCRRVGDVSRRLMLNAGFGTDLTKVWVKRLWEDPWFADAVNRCWKQQVEAGIEQHLLQYIDQMSNQLSLSQEQNFRVWPIARQVYDEYRLFSTYREGVEYLKKFITDHAAYLTEVFAEMAVNDTPPEPIPSVPFELDEQFYYRISNSGSNKLLDVDGESTESEAGIVMWSAIPDRLSQQWAIDRIDDTHVRIVNSGSGMALTDVAQKNGPQYMVGTQLVQTPVDETDDRQAWEIAAVSTGNVYALINKATQLAINNASGSATDGNRVISYTNDERNEVSKNRQWYVEKTEPREIETGIEAVPAEPQYAIYYSPSMQTIRFVAEGTLAELAAVPDVEVQLFTTNGVLVRTFRATEVHSVSDLQPAVYILSWNDGTRQRSLRFMKSE